MYISPSVLGSSPAIIESNVDFPQPLGPIILIYSPFSTEKFILFKALT